MRICRGRRFQADGAATEKELFESWRLDRGTIKSWTTALKLDGGIVYFSAIRASVNAILSHHKLEVVSVIYEIFTHVTVTEATVTQSTTCRAICQLHIFMTRGDL